MAQKFRKIDPRIWNDEGFSALDVEARLLAFWLLTSNRVNRCGIVIWSAGLASEETGLDRHRVEGVLDTVCHTLKWVFDMESKTVFLARWWRYNPPDNESALKGALGDLHDLPRNSLKPYLEAASKDIKPDLKQVYHTVLDTVYHTVSDTVSPQEKEKEKEKKKDSSPESGGVSEGPKSKPQTTEAKPKKSPKEKPPPKTHERNPLFDAIAEVSGLDPTTAGGLIGTVAASLASAEPPYAPEDVRLFASRFWELLPYAAREKRPRPTPKEIEKNVGLIRARPSAPEPQRIYDTID